MQQKNKTVLDLLQGSTAFQNSSLRIAWGKRQGVVHVRNGSIAAAEVGVLSGNGAILDIARWQGIEVVEFEGDPVIKKNVTLSINDIERVFSEFSIPAAFSSTYDDQIKLEEAIILIHQFKYREAGVLLAEILKYNRFNYLAWLWYSRLLGKIESIRKSLDEAQKWGDHAPDVWLEVKKVGIGLANIEKGGIKRCLFCWTPLNVDDRYCCYCKASQMISKNVGREPKKSELKKAANNYLAGFLPDRNNSRVSYTLALLFFSLKMYEKSLKYIEKAIEISPGYTPYLKAGKIISGLLKNPVKNGKHSYVQSPPVRPRVVAESAAADNSKPVILVVEDSPTARKVIKMVLDREGFGVIEASSGEEALTKAKDSRPGLILLDVMLPDMTGYDILPQLRENEHLLKTPVVMLTGKKGSMDRMKGMMAGSSEYLTKPFNPQKLTSVIKNYL